MRRKAPPQGCTGRTRGEETRGWTLTQVFSGSLGQLFNLCRYWDSMEYRVTQGIRKLVVDEVAWSVQNHSDLNLTQLHICELSFHGQHLCPQVPLKLGPSYYSSWSPLSTKVCESPLCNAVPHWPSFASIWSSHFFANVLLHHFSLPQSFWKYWPLWRIMEIILTGG